VVFGGCGNVEHDPEKPALGLDPGVGFRFSEKIMLPQGIGRLLRSSHPPVASTAMAKLPAEGTQARRFGKTRSAQSTALLEDYAELIADLLEGEGEARPTDIARRLGVSHATAIKTIARLKRAGLATARPYRGVFLTEKGHELADRVRVRHRLVVDLLRAIGVPTESAEADAEGIEHYVSEVTLKAFAHFLKART
jgi:DtxR family manganese transport transcriptional regulator